MSIKLTRNTYPKNHTKEDFECFGPPALKDGDFDSSKIADLGCFNQAGIDTNKYYHGAVVQSKNTQGWFTYFEWGRTGAAAPSFLFIECHNQNEAQIEFSKQLMSKNVKRGSWTTIAGIQTLQARPGKDCYLVRPQATRSTGLPSARTIHLPQGVTSKKPPTATPATPTKAKAKATSNCDPETRALLNTLNMGTVSYTKGIMANASIPTIQAINEARQILGEAAQVTTRLPQDPTIQAHDRTLLNLTSVLYGRIPKKKALRIEPIKWVLNSTNIQGWNDDLDAFEEALAVLQNSPTMGQLDNPLASLGIEMNHLAPMDPIRQWLETWSQKATANKHQQFGKMNIAHIWKIKRDSTHTKFLNRLKEIAPHTPSNTERPHNQRGRRPDLPNTPNYKEGNAALLFHGTRSVNLGGLLRKSFVHRNQLKNVTLTAALLGNGTYFADDWKKSAGYTSLTNAHWAGGTGKIPGRKAFLLVCSVALGNVHVAARAHSYTAPPKGYHSVMGKPNVTSLGGRSYLLNPEYVDYTTDNHMDYLIEFDA